MAPFYISCTTCKARLKIRDESAVGEIHMCPKCGSMVMITPPRSGSSAPEGSGSGEFSKPALASAAAPLQMTFDDAVQILDQTSAPPPMPIAPAAAISTAARPVDLWSDTVDEVPASSDARAPAFTMPPVAEDAANLADTVDGSTSGEFAAPELGAAGESYSEPLLPGEQWISPQAHVWRQWILLGGSAVMGIALAVAVFGYAVIHATRARQAAVAQAQEDPKATSQPDDTPEPPETDATIENAAANSENAEEPPAAAVADPPDAPQTDNPPQTPSVADPDEPNPPAPVGDSPFERTSPAPTEVAVNSDLLDKFGDFLGTSEAASPPASEPASADLDSPPAEAPSASASDEPPAAETPLPRPRPRHVDVAARLADPIVEIEFASVPLVEFLEFISDLSTIPISIEPEALTWRRLSPTSPVSVSEKDTTVEGVLLAALTPLNLSFVAEDGHLLVSGDSARDARMRTIKHPVDDLARGDAERLAELAQQITRLVAPESWKAAGGEGTVDIADGDLSITQTEAIHFRVIAFCEALRQTRGMPQRTRFDAALFQPQAQTKAAQEKLAAPVTLNYRHPAELMTILAALGKPAGLTILVDWRAAADAGWPPDAKASVVAEGGPLSEALARLLTPMDLTYRIVDGATLEITTPEKLRTRIETVFYPVSDLVKDKAGEATLLQRLETELGEHFAEGRGAYHLDADGKHLIAALPQPEQNELASLLETLRKP